MHSLYSTIKSTYPHLHRWAETNDKILGSTNIMDVLNLIDRELGLHMPIRSLTHELLEAGEAKLVRDE